MQRRKYIRIALTDEDMKAFIKAKKKAEEEMKIKIRDSAFVLSLVRWAIKG